MNICAEGMHTVDGLARSRLDHALMDIYAVASKKTTSSAMRTTFAIRLLDFYMRIHRLQSYVLSRRGWIDNATLLDLAEKLRLYLTFSHQRILYSYNLRTNTPSSRVSRFCYPLHPTSHYYSIAHPTQ